MRYRGLIVNRDGAERRVVQRRAPDEMATTIPFLQIGAELDVERLATFLLKKSSIKNSLIIGIDGPGASGKSTLAISLADVLGNASVVHGDDFYLPSSLRPTTNFGVGDQYDLARLLGEVVQPHAEYRDICFQRYDWDRDRLDGWTEVPANNHLVVEGTYSTEARLRDLYTYRIFCDANKSLRLARGLQRDGEDARSRWLDEWMPAENQYFMAQQPAAHAHLVLDSSVTDPNHPRYMVIGGPQTAFDERC